MANLSYQLYCICNQPKAEQLDRTEDAFALCLLALTLTAQSIPSPALEPRLWDSNKD